MPLSLQVICSKVFLSHVELLKEKGRSALEHWHQITYTNGFCTCSVIHDIVVCARITS